MMWKQVAGVLVGGSALYTAVAVTSGGGSLARNSMSPRESGGTLLRAPRTTSWMEVLPFLGSGTDDTDVPRLLDPVPVANADFSGTRLKAKYKAGSDGSKLYVPNVMRDTTLDVDCEYARAMDDAERCLPIVGPEAVDVWATPCICVATSFGCPLTPPKYAYMADSPGPVCPTADGSYKRHVYAVGALMAPQPSCTSGACYAIGAEIPAATFAAGTRGTDP